MPRANSGPKLVKIAGHAAWYIRWYDRGAKRQRSTGTSDRAEADLRLADFLIERHTPVRPDGPRDPHRFPIEEAIALYAVEHSENTADPKRLGYAMKALLSFWEGKAVGEVTAATCREYARKRGRSDGTLRRELGVLRAALNHCAKFSYLAAVPHVHLPTKPEGKSRFLTEHEAARLLHAALRARADTRLYLPLFVVMALYTGQRKEALLSLRWPQVDLARRKIDFNPPGRKRTNKKRPIIDIPDRLMTFLRLARKRGSDLGYVIHRGGDRIKDIGDNRSGSFGRACKRAGLVDVTPHTLRHTCGTWMAQRGVDLFTIGGWLGQSNVTTTELYAHHHPDYLSDARRAADRRRR